MGLLTWLFGSSLQLKSAVGDDECNWEDAGRGRHKNILGDYPNDYVIYLSYIEVAGVSFRKRDVFKWADGRGLSLEWRREPDNEHDRNALMIFGRSDLGSHHIGYVPKEIAARIVKSGMIEQS